MAIDNQTLMLCTLLNAANGFALEAVRELTRAHGPQWVVEFGQRMKAMVKTGFAEGVSIEQEAALYDAQLLLVSTFIREGLKDGDGNEIVRDGDS